MKMVACTLILACTALAGCTQLVEVHSSNAASLKETELASTPSFVSGLPQDASRRAYCGELASTPSFVSGLPQDASRRAYCGELASTPSFVSGVPQDASRRAYRGELLWFLPRDETEKPENPSVSEATLRFEASLSRDHFWMNPPKFLLRVLELMTVYAARNFQALKDSSSVPEADATYALKILVNAYEHMASSFPAYESDDDFGIESIVKKIFLASEAFWTYVEDSRQEHCKGTSGRWHLKKRSFTPRMCNLFRLLRLRRLRRLVKCLQEAVSDMYGVYFTVGTLSMISSNMLGILRRHVPKVGPQ